MNRVLKYIFLHIFFAAIFCFEFSQTAYAQQKYRIGAILPLTGEAASLGRYVKNGIDLALSSLSANDRENIEVLFEDDKLINTNSVAAFQKLVTIDKVDAIFGLGSGVGNTLAPLAEKSGKVAIFIGASDASIAKGRKFVFTHWIGPDTEADLLVKEIDRRGYKKIAFIASEFDGAIAIEQAFFAALKSAGKESLLAYNDRYLIESKDFRSFIAKVRAKKIDAVGAVLYPGALAAFAKQLRDLAPQLPLFGFETFEDTAEVKSAGGALEGKWYASGDDPNPQFRSQYMAAYKEEPGWAAANSYDSVKLLVDALKRVGANNNAVSQYLSVLKDYEGACGKYSASGDNRFDLPAAIKEVTKEGFKKLSH